jgi:prophage maintenance system killer protein
VDLHAALVARPGGEDGLRDPALLSSAPAQPMMTGALAEMAAACLFHPVTHHTIVDDSRRIGLHACQNLLERDGCRIAGGREERHAPTRRTALGGPGQEQVAAPIRAHAAGISPGP